MSELGKRTHFADLAWRVYLDHAAVGPLPRPAVMALGAAVRSQAIDGVAAFPRLLETAGHARDAFAALVGADPDSVSLMGSTSAGVTAIANSLRWRRGDRILLFEGEFPTNTTPWQQAAQREGVEIVWLPAATLATDDGLAKIEDELRRGIRLLAVSVVQFQTGLRAPLNTLVPLAHEHGALVFVDAIQAAGIVPFRMDDSGIDFLASGGHKWLMGPLGTGLLAVRPDHYASLAPSTASWLSHVDPLRFLVGEADRLNYDQPLDRGRALFEGGTQNLSGHTALATSMQLHLEVGVGAIYDHVQRYHDALEPGLLERGFESARSADPARRSGILSVRPPSGCSLQPLVSVLHGSGISVSTPDGWLRFSPSWPNHLDEIPDVLAAVDLAVRASRTPS